MSEARLVVGCDQTLALGEQRFDKPVDRAAARAQLMAMRGKTHELHSAVAVCRGGAVAFAEVAVARLTMRDILGSASSMPISTRRAASVDDERRRVSARALRHPSVRDGRGRPLHDPRLCRCCRCSAIFRAAREALCRMRVAKPRACIMGHPVAHSRSPMLHGYWLRTLGIDGAYEFADVAPENFEAFFRGLAANGFVGGNITIPHKEAAFRLVDAREPAADTIGAVNTVWYEGGPTDRRQHRLARHRRQPRRHLSRLGRATAARPWCSAPAARRARRLCVPRPEILRRAGQPHA